MILALAVLLLQPQVHPQPSINVSMLGASADASSSAVSGSAKAAASPAAAGAEANSSGAAYTPVFPAATPGAEPAASPEPYPAEPIVLSPVPNEATESSSLTLPSAPTPRSAGSLKPWKAVVSNLLDPQFESRRDQRMWLALSITQHTAAGFDSWTTRREISSGQGQETNPFLKPFAGNDSLYVVMQITPVALDYLAHHMMYSSHAWERHIWWVPQVVGAASSFAAGGHNLNVHAAQ